MLFNPDPKKQAAEMLFSKEREKDNYPPLTFNGNNLKTAISQKQLCLVLDFKFDFNDTPMEKLVLYWIQYKKLIEMQG